MEVGGKGERKGRERVREGETKGRGKGRERAAEGETGKGRTSGREL